MSGETEANVSAWTIDSLKLHLEHVIAALDRLIDQRFEAYEKAISKAEATSEKAIDKAEANSERWRASSNEWRGAMNDREKNFLSQDAYDRAHVALADKMDAAIKALDDKVNVLAARVAEMATVTG